MTKFVVHCKRNLYDVYIGRPSKWGNPFKVGKDGKRGECIELYKKWLQQPEQEKLLSEVEQELKGKVLGCWCDPNPCHGNILAEIANGNRT